MLSSIRNAKFSVTPDRLVRLACLVSTLLAGMARRSDYVVEKVHFQSVPGGHVVGNLYRPAKVEGRLPAVVYFCGHTNGKVNARYQANPRWFGTHGYVCLVLDPIQLGEAQGYHHGTSRGGIRRIGDWSATE